ncbi:hypothetical protein LVB87_03320 [Lysobacter sp. KIS68-7]|uniref:hypothetical protein n=1 Tax=Lysobacter sp. KIS68-7 TaxID=2904252 RepID=UPI001E449511|nr:hypothetical protein [Lysobacter sp. KIS68-7]UHQ20206.1 hypothetical protein LVB87_03320 [Lysobacter sp. KIS68-7]
MLILLFLAYSVFCYWVIVRDGAEVLVNWEWLPLFDLFAASLTARELKFSVCISWLVSLVFMLYTLFSGDA